MDTESQQKDLTEFPRSYSKMSVFDSTLIPERKARFSSFNFSVIVGLICIMIN